MSQNFSPVVLIDEEEFWAPSIYMGKPYPAFQVGDPAVNIVYSIFALGPIRIAWVGERSNMENVKEQYSVDPIRYDAFVKEAKKLPLPDTPNNVFVIDRRKSDELLAMRQKKFLANEDKKEYIALEPHTTDLRKIDVLPCMTLVSSPEVMQLDGINYTFDGSWAFDKLRLLKSIPEGYREIKPNMD